MDRSEPVFNNLLTGVKFSAVAKTKHTQRPLVYDVDPWRDRPYLLPAPARHTGARAPLEVHAANVAIAERFGFINGYYVSSLDISGNIVFDSGCTYKMSNLNSRVTRTYYIRVTRGSEPVPGANIEVRGANTIISNMVTDAAVYTQFNLEYKDRFEIVKFPNPGGPYTITEFNMTSPVILTVSHSGDIYQKEVGLLTTTPIEVAFPVYTRPQREAMAALFSVALILIAAYAVFSPRLARRA